MCIQIILHRAGMLQVIRNHQIDVAQSDGWIIFLYLLRCRAVLELTHNRIKGHARARDADNATLAPRQRDRLGYVQLHDTVVNLSRRRQSVEHHIS